MKRRAFLAATAATIGAPLCLSVAAPAKPIVRFPVDCDFSVSTFLCATSLAGAVDHPGQYVLTVHPKWVESAEYELRRVFTEPYRWQERVTLQTDEFEYVDEWTLEGRDAIAWSRGA